MIEIVNDTDSRVTAAILITVRWFISFDYRAGDLCPKLQVLDLSATKVNANALQKIATAAVHLKVCSTIT